MTSNLINRAAGAAAIAALTAATGMASAQASFAAGGTLNEGDSFGGTYVGPNAVFNTLNFTGTINPLVPGTFGLDADFELTYGGANFILTPSGDGGITAPTPVDFTGSGLFWFNTGDNFSATYTDSFDDGPGDDATVSDAQITFSDGPEFTDLGNFFVGSPLAFDSNGSDFDTELALYTADGTLIAEDDDGGDGLQSLIDAGGLAVGDYILALGGFNSGFGDQFAFGGGSEGIYNLNVNGDSAFSGAHLGGTLTSFTFSVVVPAPGTAALAGLAGLVAVRRRR